MFHSGVIFFLKEEGGCFQNLIEGFQNCSDFRKISATTKWVTLAIPRYTTMTQNKHCTKISLTNNSRAVISCSCINDTKLNVLKTEIRPFTEVHTQKYMLLGK